MNPTDDPWLKDFFSEFPPTQQLQHDKLGDDSKDLHEQLLQNTEGSANMENRAETTAKTAESKQESRAHFNVAAELVVKFNSMIQFTKPN